MINVITEVARKFRVNVEKKKIVSNWMQANELNSKGRIS